MMTEDGMIGQGWQGLADAIILQAVEDYREARRKARRFPGRKGPRAVLRETERFFRSRWFARLTDADGEELIRKLKEETV